MYTNIAKMDSRLAVIHSEHKLSEQEIKDFLLLSWQLSNYGVSMIKLLYNFKNTQSSNLKINETNVIKYYCKKYKLSHIFYFTYSTDFKIKHVENYNQFIKEIFSA